LRIEYFDFPLPEELIAQHPAARRDQSRLMVVDRSTGRIEHYRFLQLPQFLAAGDLLVWNTTRVFPARLSAARPGRHEAIEVLLVRETEAGCWIALFKPGRKAPAGQELLFGPVRGTVEAVRPDGSRLIRFGNPAEIMTEIERIGVPPLPPYIRRGTGTDWADDKARYQTVYARQTGSVAAPTAGLHFTPEVIDELDRQGVRRTEVLLHVGYGTFQPVRCADVAEHRMEPERFEISAETAGLVRDAREAGRRVVAVGSTTTRVLEYVAASGPLRSAAGECDLFIYPGFEFRVVDVLLTNFHLPRSTLFVLVSAFASRELMLEAYRVAVEERYRFFSYGDAMLIR
jgi:S-adenosylmethionine:tRNA ribosyltransferase-isomerase